MGPTIALESKSGTIPPCVSTFHLVSNPDLPLTLPKRKGRSCKYSITFLYHLEFWQQNLIGEYI